MNSPELQTIFCWQLKNTKIHHNIRQLQLLIIVTRSGINYLLYKNVHTQYRTSVRNTTFCSAVVHRFLFRTDLWRPTHTHTHTPNWHVTLETAATCSGIVQSTCKKQRKALFPSIICIQLADPTYTHVS